MIFYGLLNLSLTGYIIAALLFTHLTIVSVTVFLHRCQAHSALRLHPFISHVFRCWLWLSTGMITKAWVAIHRKHHARCETAEDPHSPQVLGIKTVLWQGAELYRKEALNQETLNRYGHNTPDDWIERNLYSRYPRYGITIMLIIDLLLFGIPGVTIWAIQMMWIPFFAAGVINGIGHYYGYRNFECPDAATNIGPFGILIGGEELHNNHHTYPTSAKLSVKWYEFDLGWFYISVFRALGLAEVKKTSPKYSLAHANARQIDGHTLRALVTHRFQIWMNFTKQVLMPIFDEEKQKIETAKHKIREQFEHAKNLLQREESLIDSKRREELSTFLSAHTRVAQVYQFRQKLQEIWNKTTASQRELIEALQDWCHQAEATGIASLQQFSNEIRRLG